MRMTALNDIDRVIGESHGRAKLTDHDVELINNLLEHREEMVAMWTAQGYPRGKIFVLLNLQQLSLSGIAEKFEVSKSLIRDIFHKRVRAQIPSRWVRAPAKPIEQGAPAPARPAPATWAPKGARDLVKEKFDRRQARRPATEPKIKGIAGFPAISWADLEMLDPATRLGVPEVCQALGLASFSGLRKVIKRGELTRGDRGMIGTTAKKLSWPVSAVIAAIAARKDEVK